MRRVLRGVAVGTVAGALLLGGLPGASAAKGGGSGSTGTGSCSKRNPCTTADTTAPLVAISSPANGATVAGSVTVAGSASDNVGVARVEVQVDGGAVQVASGTSSWSAALDTRTLADGSHTVTARALDAAGLAATGTISVTVANAAVDTAPPVVTIAAPTSGATVSGPITVTGEAADDSAVVTVEVAVDGGSFAVASGTSSWTKGLDTAAYPDGTHTITARATDTAGKVHLTSTTTTFENTPTAAGDTIVTDPAAQHDLAPLGRTRLPQWGSLTGMLYSEQWTNRKVAFFRDAETGASSAATLPADSLDGWHNAATVMTSADELWVVGGIGPLFIRQYRLSGSPMPSSATLVSSRQVGDTDSRPGDLVRLESGALVAVWHQQGRQGPQGLHVGHLPVGGSWSFLPAITFTNTMSSNQVLAQHPGDGAVWLFHNADTAGRIDAVRLLEADGRLSVASELPSFIVPSVHGLDGPDPENPFLAVAADPATRTLHLAYQSGDRRWFGSGSQLMIGSRIAIARVEAAGGLSFLERAPVWAERVSPLGLMMVGGEPVLSYLPVDESSMTASAVEVIRRTAAGWDAPTTFGEKDGQTYVIGYGTGRAEVATKLGDGRIHLRTF